MARTSALICALMAIILVPNVGFGASLSLNGVPIDGTTNQRFEDCTVVIDQYGNINIIAKGYAVSSGATAAVPEAKEATPAAIGGTPTKRYWVVTDKSAPGMTQYEIDVFINKKWVRTFFAEEKHVVVELTQFLKVGPNKITFVAKKKIDSAGRKSSSPKHYFRLVIGEGHLGGRNVVITKKLIDYRRTALEAKDFKSDESVTAR